MQEKMENWKTEEAIKTLLAARELPSGSFDALASLLIRNQNNPAIRRLFKEFNETTGEEREKYELEVNHLRRRKSQTDALLQSAQQEISSLQNAIAQIESSKTELSINVDDMRSELDKLRKVLSEKSDESQRQTIEIDSLRNQTEELKMLGNAATFWRKKAKVNIVFSIIFLTIFSLGAYQVLRLAISNWDSIYLLISRNKDGEINLSSVGILALLALPVYWLLRIFSRMLLDNFVLWQDAGARSTMLNTYLALVGNPNANIRPEDRTMILQAAFRPPPGQNDDSFPAHWLEVITKIVEKLKS